MYSFIIVIQIFLAGVRAGQSEEVQQVLADLKTLHDSQGALFSPFVQKRHMTHKGA